ncbi:MAG: TlpA family protein disulfide reductase [Armatimonadetes bacterium]|nr:TlpA family protein disulfide reductase [Armatimonadota bacterium]
MRVFHIRHLLCGAAAAIVVVAPVRAQSTTTVAVPAIDAAGLKKQVAARKGKIVVVNLWALWCGPCVKEYPALVKFGNAQAKRGVELVTVSFDTPKRDAAKVAAFVKKNGQKRGAFINGAGLDPEGYPQYLDPKLPADSDFALPRTYIFDRKGKLVKALTGEQSDASLAKATAGL